MKKKKISNGRKSDYSQLKKQLFKNETVDSLYDKIKAFENNPQEN
ncbi:hypothetical protein ACN4EE_01755 [Geminocystis sp. CENA526]